MAADKGSGVLEKFPKLFNMDNYEKCIENQKLYCKVTGKLFPNSNGSEIWKDITMMELDNNLYDRTLIHRGLCLQQHQNSVAQQSEELLNSEMQKYNLLARVVRVFCTDGNIPFNTTDKIIMAAGTFIFSVLIAATIMHRKTKDSKGRLAYIFSNFSLQNTWKKMTITTGKEDFERLKAFQAIRVFTTTVIMILHQKIMYMDIYISNPEYLEDVLRTSMLRYVNIPDGYWVLSFLFISAFLLTNQIYTLVERKQVLTLKDVMIISINRYFRLGVAAFVTILFVNSSFLKRISGIATFNIVSYNQEACENNWLPVLLFYNNFFYMKDICNPVTWSNAADFQMYLIILIILYVIFKFKLHAWTVMALAVTVSAGLFGLVIYHYDLDIIWRPIIRIVESAYFFESISGRFGYMSTIAISTSSFLGMVFGAIYYHTKYIKVTNNWVITVLWSLGSFGIPIIVIILSIKEQHGIISAIMGPVLKPLFVLGIGIFILGTSHNIGGYAKKISEWKLFVILSNLTYSVYLCNWIMTIGSHPSLTTLKEFSIIDLALDSIVSIAQSILAGIILAITIEQPWLSIQKILLPQVKIQ